MFSEDFKPHEIQDLSGVTEPEFSKPEMQEARAFLRERYLRFMNGVIGAKANFYLYENSHVSGEFRGCDVDCLELFVHNLKTPLGVVPEAILRATDVISFTINNIKAP
ncbi:gem-associated protein 7-like [Microplitis mediator]|uniref:gem-associated protein 7 n=1 Tax=Microplitis demolitor TaxID=69319 RepID=UPI0004CCF3CA|nr:gem-associated protein 7 [Microplitis demolitor]XP_057326413.1 gem-associated protein 7-like [Microplitis mediator]